MKVGTRAHGQIIIEKRRHLLPKPHEDHPTLNRIIIGRPSKRFIRRIGTLNAKQRQSPRRLTAKLTRRRKAERREHSD